MTDDLQRLMSALGCATLADLKQQDAIELYLTASKMGMDTSAVLAEIERLLS